MSRIAAASLSRSLLGATLLLVLGSARPLSAGNGIWTAVVLEGAAVRVIAVSPVTGTVYVGTGAGGVFKSRDDGTTWHPSRRGLPSAVVYRLALVPGQPDVLYAATSAGLFKSSDGAARWSAIGPRDPIYDVEVAPSNPRIIYVSTHDQLLQSADSGAHWVVFGGQAGQLVVSSVAVDPNDPHTVVIGDQTGVQRTTDGGATWQNLLDASTVQVALDPFDPRTLYAVTSNNGFQRSQDGGANWSILNRFTYASLVADPSTPGTLYVADLVYGIFRSPDRGASWTPLYASSVQSLTVDPRDPSHLYGGLDEAGLLVSRDGGANWNKSRRGLTALQVSDLLPASDGTLYAIGRTHSSTSFESLLVRPVGETGWAERIGFSRYYLQKALLDPTAPGTLYLGFAGRLFRSRDGGKTWNFNNVGLPKDEYVVDLALSPAAPTTVYAITSVVPASDLSCPNCPSYVFRSEDSGDYWFRLTVPAGSHLDAVAVDPVKPATVYLLGSKLFRSDNRGITWRPIGRGVTGSWHQLLIDPRRHDTLYGVTAAAKGPHVSKSTDGGVTWTAAATGLPGEAEIRTLVFDPRSSSILYAATSAGVFVTENGGRRWAALNNGLLDPSVLSIAVDPEDPKTLYAGTSGLGGLFVLTRE